MGVPDSLTRRQRRFVAAYLRTWNAAKAAREAGYSETTARAISYLLLRKPAIKEAIRLALEQEEMQTAEIMARLTQQARLNPSSFFVFKNGKAGRELVSVKWETVEEMGHLVKKISYDRAGRPVLEFHDPQHALELLAKRQGALIDRRELTGANGKAIEVIHVRAATDDDSTD